MTSVFKFFPSRPLWKALSFDDLDLSFSFSFFLFRPYSLGQQLRKVTLKKEEKKERKCHCSQCTGTCVFSQTYV